ncbi:hypothetical protein GIB67_031485 [Kingdonia uniflora]|uniref:FBD domain-containing protein n=1 Tax=Kingdonia uniflora TaxID=39325 RepID=A0A7J7MNG4_9MAGN|nr:hypothetical protein GIB67_031485 [Kingdonia uniflora]
MGVFCDYISNLPDNVIERLLLEFPMKDGAKTSVLSTKWRYKWAAVPQLKFYDYIDEIPANYSIVNIIDHVLLLHIRPIHKFELSHTCVNNMLSFRDMDRWIFVLSSLRINAPNLRDFQFYGIFEDIVLKNTVLLSTVGIYLESLIKDDKSGRLTDFICSLPRIKELTMDTNLLKYLVRDNVPGDLPVQSTRLKFLSMLINFLSPKEILAALCMLRCAPNLHKLEIVVCNSAQASESVEEPKIDIFQGLDYLSSTFSHLEHVKINQVAGLKLELEFIEVLLASAAGLKDVTIELGIGYERSEIYKELLQFRRASPQAKIIYLDH